MYVLLCERKMICIKDIHICMVILYDCWKSMEYDLSVYH